MQRPPTYVADGTNVQSLVEPPDNWPGRAAVEWARQLARGHRFDARAKEHIAVAEVVDRIYGRDTWR
jgi:hypothetical protein